MLCKTTRLNTFFVKTITDWNRIEDNFVNANSLEQFKKINLKLKIDVHLLVCVFRICTDRHGLNVTCCSHSMNRIRFRFCCNWFLFNIELPTGCKVESRLSSLHHKIHANWSSQCATVISLSSWNHINNVYKLDLHRFCCK